MFFVCYIVLDCSLIGRLCFVCVKIFFFFLVSVGFLLFVVFWNVFFVFIKFSNFFIFM